MRAAALRQSLPFIKVEDKQLPLFKRQVNFPTFAHKRSKSIEHILLESTNKKNSLKVESSSLDNNELEGYMPLPKLKLSDQFHVQDSVQQSVSFRMIEKFNEEAHNYESFQNHAELLL